MIDNITIGELKQFGGILGASAPRPVPFSPGNKYLIRTGTVYVIGRVREVVGDFLVLDDASWVADTGKFSEAFKTGELNEVERTPNGHIVSLGAIFDAQPWELDLPAETK